MIRVHPNGMGTRSSAVRRPVPLTDARQNTPARDLRRLLRASRAAKIASSSRQGDQPPRKAIKARTTPAEMAANPMKEIKE